MGENNTKSAIEAMLFASEKPLTIEQLRSALGNLEATSVRAGLEELAHDYEEQNRGMRIVEIAGGFRMVTSTNFGPFLRKLFKDRNVERLSKPALETLAIIAYKQPVTRLEIQLLRNVNVDGVIKSLLERNVIRIAGRKKAPGRPCVYGTTRQFLEYFGLKSLDELPKMQDFTDMAMKREPGEVELIDEQAADNKQPIAEETNESKAPA